MQLNLLPKQKVNFMKVIKIIGHPVLVMSLFLVLLISGRSFGGFFMLYIIMGLPAGTSDSILSIIGLSIMFTGYKIYRKYYHPLKPILYIIGNSVMLIALATFFKVTKGYNISTFEQTLPILSFIFYGVSVICNIVFSINLLFTKCVQSNKDYLKVAP
jgi:hypothetical protein